MPQIGHEGVLAPVPTRGHWPCLFPLFVEQQLQKNPAPLFQIFLPLPQPVRESLYTYFIRQQLTPVKPDKFGLLKNVPGQSLFKLIPTAPFGQSKYDIKRVQFKNVAMRMSSRWAWAIIL